MNLGERIKERREQKGLTLEEVGEYVGVTKSTVRKWETGDIENMKRDKIAKLAEVLSVSPLYIMGMIDTYNMKDTIGNPIPLLGSIAAGSPILAEQNIEDYFNLDKKIKADFCLRIKGDSMININIMDGDIVFIKKQEDLDNGEYVHVIAWPKELHREDKYLLTFRANPDYRPGHDGPEEWSDWVAISAKYAGDVDVRIKEDNSRTMTLSNGDVVNCDSWNGEKWYENGKEYRPLYSFDYETGDVDIEGIEIS